MSYGQQSSDSSSQSYGPIGGGARRDLLQRNLLFGLMGKDWTAGGGGLLGNLEARAATPVTYQTPELTSAGLFKEQETALRQPFEQAVAQAMSRASGNFAQRGFLRPENIQAIAGSAAQNVAPSFAQLFANLAGQNVAERTKAPLIQEDLTRQRWADLLQALGLGTSLLGGENFSKSTSGGFQAGLSGLTYNESKEKGSTTGSTKDE